MRFLSWLFNRADQDKPSPALPAGTALPLLLKQGQDPFGVLIAYPDGLKDRMLRAIMASQDHGQSAAGTRIGPMVVEKLAQALPMGLSAFSMNGLYQIVASPTVLAGLKSGTLEFVHSSGGLLSAVRNTATGQFAAGVTFSPASIAPIVVPVVVWQVVHTVFAVRELSKINERLDTIQRGIEKLTRHNQARAFGQLGASIKALQQILDQHGVTGRFTDDMRHRLSMATRDIDASLFELEFKIRDVHARSEQLRQECRQKGESAALKLYVQFMRENTDFIADAKLHLMACQASILGACVWVTHDLEFAPDYVWRRHECVADELKELETASVQLQFMDGLKDDAKRLYAEMGPVRKWWNKEPMETIERQAETAREVASAPKANRKPGIEPSLLVWRDARGELTCMATDKEIPAPSDD